MAIFDIHTAKIRLTRLIERAAAGEEIIISKRGKPRAKLVPLIMTSLRKGRRLGRLTGRLSIPDDFDAPLPSGDLGTFETQDTAKAQALKVLLADAPLEGIDLTREPSRRPGGES